jgi:hypothetical protein
LNVYVPETETYCEVYLRVPGFGQHKERFRRFLQRAYSDSGPAK